MLFENPGYLDKLTLRFEDWSSGGHLHNVNNVLGW